MPRERANETRVDSSAAERDRAGSQRGGVPNIALQHLIEMAEDDLNNLQEATQYDVWCYIWGSPYFSLKKLWLIHGPSSYPHCIEMVMEISLSK